MQNCCAQSADWAEVNAIQNPGLRDIYETFTVLKWWPGWWNIYSRSGSFTHLDFLELLLRMEASGYGSEISAEIWKEAMFRNFNYRMDSIIGEQAKATSIEHVFKYIKNRKLAHGGGREVLLKRGEDPNVKWNESRVSNYIDFSDAFLDHDKSWDIDVWFDKTAPMEWANFSMIPSTKQQEFLIAKSPGKEKNEIYATTKFRVGNFGFVINYQQAQYWYDTLHP
jgi:hypothetical protein